MYLNDTTRIFATVSVLGVDVTCNNLVATAESPAPTSSSVPLFLTSLLVFHSLIEIKQVMSLSHPCLVACLSGPSYIGFLSVSLHVMYIMLISNS